MKNLLEFNLNNDRFSIITKVIIPIYKTDKRAYNAGIAVGFIRGRLLFRHINIKRSLFFYLAHKFKNFSFYKHL